jgi:hypothetical protein
MTAEVFVQTNVASFVEEIEIPVTQQGHGGGVGKC